MVTDYGIIPFSNSIPSLIKIYKIIIIYILIRIERKSNSLFYKIRLPECSFVLFFIKPVGILINAICTYGAFVFVDTLTQAEVDNYQNLKVKLKIAI